MGNALFIAGIVLLVLVDTALTGGLRADAPADTARALGWTLASRALPGVALGLLVWYMAPVLRRKAEHIPDWRWFALAATTVLVLLLQAVG